MESHDLAGVVAPVLAAMESSQNAVIATLVAGGSLPNLKLGARLLVYEHDEPVGAVHPALDPVIITDARTALAQKRSGVRSYRLTEEGIEYAGVQGGDVDVFFEVIRGPSTLIIVGAGHIAVPLAAFGSLLDFEVIVVDDRQEFVTKERFPTADQLLAGPYRETVAAIPIDDDTCIVLVTRGHVHDQACLEQVLDSPAAYIGMIGSQRRVRTVMRHAKERGYDVAKLERVFAPIGLDIGSHTPAEIALAIMGEIVNLQRGGRAPSSALQERLHL